MQISEKYTHNRVTKIFLDEKEIKDALASYVINKTGISPETARVTLSQANTSTGFYYQANIELIVNLPPVEPGDGAAPIRDDVVTPPDESQTGETQ